MQKLESLSFQSSIPEEKLDLEQQYWLSIDAVHTESAVLSVRWVLTLIQQHPMGWVLSLSHSYVKTLRHRHQESDGARFKPRPLALKPVSPVSSQSLWVRHCSGAVLALAHLLRGTNTPVEFIWAFPQRACGGSECTVALFSMSDRGL